MSTSKTTGDPNDGEAARDALRYWNENILKSYQKRKPPPTTPIKAPQPITKVAIVGGGVAGLRAAMMLRAAFHNDPNGPDIVLYESSNRVGGRLYTYRFPGGGEWDYFDVGAMRFPRTPVMQATFDLFQELDLPLLPYNIAVDQNRKAFNGQHHQVDDIDNNFWANDPFRVGVAHGGTVPDQFATQSPGALLLNVIQHLITGLVDNRQAGIEALNQLDHHSTRSYLLQVAGYEPALIDYIETVSVGTGFFDRALSEVVFEELCFRYDQPNPINLDWFCVEGGSGRIIEAMEAHFVQNPGLVMHSGHRVTATTFNENGAAPEHITISGVRYLGNEPLPFLEDYSHVIFALPPPCVRSINHSTCGLDYEQQNALRIVSVGPSCKIGIKFKTAWWTGPGINMTGGQSSTDRLVRSIVYPSYGNGASTVLIASYSWTQDAVVLGAWMQGHGSPAEERLRDIVLEDIAHVHHDQITLQELQEGCQAIFPYDWTHSPDSIGAFGLFGPHQFQQHLPALTRPAARGHLHFIGETISTTHGWVAGSLESAGRGVFQLLALNQIAHVVGPPGNEPPAPVGPGPFSIVANALQNGGEGIVRQLYEAIWPDIEHVNAAGGEDQVDTALLSPFSRFICTNPDLGIDLAAAVVLFIQQCAISLQG